MSCGSAAARPRCCISPPRRLAVDGGIMVTGSHNPPDHNGFKMVLRRQGVFRRGDPEARRNGAPRSALPTGRAARSSSTASSTITSRGWRRITTGRAAAEGRLGLRQRRHRRGRREPDAKRCRAATSCSTRRSTARFRRITPTRPSPENLVQLQQAVAAERCDLGIGFDGDGDRIGVVDAQGRILWGDQLLLVLARDVLSRNPGAPILADVKSSQVLFDEIAARRRQAGHDGNRPFADQGAARRDRRAARRRDERPHLFRRRAITGSTTRSMSRCGCSTSWRAPTRASPTCSTGCRRCSTRRNCALDCDEARKFAIVEEVKERLRRRGAEMSSISTACGCAPPDGWWLMRASNTQAVVVVRAEVEQRSGAGAPEAAARRRTGAERPRIAGIRTDPDKTAVIPGPPLRRRARNDRRT